MEPKAIVYTSNTGFTAQYAALLAKRTGLRAYTLDEALEKLSNGAEIIYMGWIMTGKIQGFIKAAKNYQIVAVCGVGMGVTGSQQPTVRQANGLSDALPLFTVQGGLNMKKLHGFNKVMMKIMAKNMIPKLEGKRERTPGETTLLNTLRNGGDFVSMQNLKDLLAWYSETYGRKV